MPFEKDFKEYLFKIDQSNFSDAALSLFEFQYKYCNIYQKYADFHGKSPKNVKNIEDIPFLPIEFFKNHIIKTGNWKEEAIFLSSGTTQSSRSRHYLRDQSFYHKVCRRIYEGFFSEKIEQTTFLSLLPSYQEQGNSSLINMVDSFLDHSKKDGKYLEDYLGDEMKEEEAVVIGVSYALLDYQEKKIIERPKRVIETGGMKGRKKEITRSELHSFLRKKFQLEEIYSEYGMTELTSQAYGKDGIFKFPAWTKVLIREINDPFRLCPLGRDGGMNIIDLANVSTCAFLETKDIGRMIDENERFEVLGRFDNSDIRG
ncbi:MAG: acyl transferase, partial [Bacteroidota bacterium]